MVKVALIGAHYDVVRMDCVVLCSRPQARALLADILHRLHELFLMELLRLLVWVRRSVLMGRYRNCLAHSLERVGLRPRTHHRLAVLKGFRASLGHRDSGLVTQLERSLAREANLVLLLHLIYLGLLLLHNVGQLQLVVDFGGDASARPLLFLRILICDCQHL